MALTATMRAERRPTRSRSKSTVEPTATAKPSTGASSTPPALMSKVWVARELPLGHGDRQIDGVAIVKSAIGSLA